MKVLVAGDFCPQSRVAESFEKKRYDSILMDVKKITSGVDYAIVNFECPIVDKEGTPLVKQGPNLKCSVKGIDALKWAGFDCVTLANNHILDYGPVGVENTIEACQKHHIDIVGAGYNLQKASGILFKEISGKRLAFINCCEHEFSIATRTSAGSNPLNPIQQFYAIKEAQKKADYVLVIVHGGHEMWQLPSPRMVETYRFFVDAGADAVVNHHQHCYSGYEVYNGKPIFYGLGNFCFDRPKHIDDIWNYGYMVELDISEDVTFRLIPYKQCGKNANVDFLIDYSKFNKTIEELNQVIANSELLQQKTDNYYQSCNLRMEDAFEPFNWKMFYIFKHRNILPSFITEKKRIRMENYICCESHREKLINWLKTR